MAKQKEPEYRLGYYWDDYLAEYRFQLQKDTGSSFKQSEEVEDGNLEWAERQSRHYGIDIPKGYYEQHDVQDKPQSLPKGTTGITPASSTYAPNPSTTTPIAMSTPTYPTPGVTQ
jgi:hypothetical protein